MVKLSDLNLQADELDNCQLTALTDFKLSWETDNRYMRFTTDEKAIRTRILEKRNQALRQIIAAFENDFTSLFNGSISEYLVNEKNKLNNTSLVCLSNCNYVNLVEENIAHTRKTLDEKIHSICTVFHKEIFDNNSYYQDAIKLHDAYYEYYCNEGNTELKAKAQRDFEKRVKPFITYLKEYGYGDMADDLDKIEKIIKHKEYFLNTFINIKHFKQCRMAFEQRHVPIKAAQVDSQKNYYRGILPTIPEEENSVRSNDTTDVVQSIANHPQSLETKIPVNTPTAFFKPSTSTLKASSTAFVPKSPSSSLNSDAKTFTPRSPFFPPNVTQSSPNPLNKVVGSQRMQRNQL